MHIGKTTDHVCFSVSAMIAQFFLSIPMCVCCQHFSVAVTDSVVICQCMDHGRLFIIHSNGLGFLKESEKNSNSVVV